MKLLLRLGAGYEYSPKVWRKSYFILFPAQTPRNVPVRGSRAQGEIMAKLANSVYRRRLSKLQIAHKMLVDICERHGVLRLNFSPCVEDLLIVCRLPWHLPVSKNHSVLQYAS